MTHPRRPPPLLALTAVAAVVAVLGLPAPPAWAARVQACALDLSSGAYGCTTEPASSPTASAGSTTLLARLYDAPNRSTADGYLDVFAAGGCDSSPDVDWELGTVPSGWNDRVSSFQGFSGCEVRLWQNGGFAGASYGPAPSAGTLGALDNATSSLTFS